MTTSWFRSPKKPCRSASIASLHSVRNRAALALVFTGRFFLLRKLEGSSRVFVVNTSAWKIKIELAALHFFVCVPSHNCEIFSSPVPSLALCVGSNDQCDGNQCCPSFGGSLRRHHQEWSLRLDSSFLIPGVVLRGHSQLVESFVWLVPPVRIDRLIALSLSWCKAVLASWSQLSGYSRFRVHFEKEERRQKKKTREKKSKRLKKERENERTREQVFVKRQKKRKRESIEKKRNHKAQKIHRTNCHIMIRKKKPAGRNYLAFFLRKFTVSTCFKLISRFEFDFRAPRN